MFNARIAIVVCLLSPAIIRAEEAKRPPSSFDAGMTRVLELEQQGLFAKALVQARELHKRFREPQQLRRIDEVRGRLSIEKREFFELRGAIESFFEGDYAASMVARQTLRNGGSTSVILLWNLRDRDNGRLMVDVLEMLLELDTGRALVFLVEHIHASPRADRSAEFVAMLIAHLDKLAPQEYYRLAHAAAAAASADFDAMLMRVDKRMRRMARNEQTARDLYFELTLDVRDALRGADRARMTQIAELVLSDPDLGTRGREPGTNWVAQYMSHLDSRLLGLQKLQFPPHKTIALFHSQLDYARQHDSREGIKAFVTAARDLEDRLENDRERATIAKLLIDAYVSLQDYAAALELVERGLPAESELWHEIIGTKLNAHLALQRGDLEAAILHFREFLKHIPEVGEVIDPVSGLTFTPDMLLARNMQRIGRLLAENGNKTEANHMYASALAQYKRAREAVRPISAEFAYIDATIKELMQARIDVD